MIKPLGKNVLVEVNNETEEKTVSGIILQEDRSVKKYTVIAIGDDKDIKVKKGQEVILREFNGKEVKFEGKDYLIISNDNILAVL